MNEKLFLTIIAPLIVTTVDGGAIVFLIQHKETVEIVTMIADILIKTIALIIGGSWALYEIKKYRAFQQWIQLDIDAYLYKLRSAVNGIPLTWDHGKLKTRPAQLSTHVVEVLLKFTNKGRTRLRLYNIQIGINTMRQPDKTKFDEYDLHLKLTRIFSSGNIVPIFGRELFCLDTRFQSDLDMDNKSLSADLRKEFNARLKKNRRLSERATLEIEQRGSEWVVTDGGWSYMIWKEGEKLRVYLKAEPKIYWYWDRLRRLGTKPPIEDLPIEKTSSYYIEPGVEQTITYLALITEPRELIQIYAEFSLEPERIFPKRRRGRKGLFPHTAARTYQIDAKGNLIKVN